MRAPKTISSLWVASAAIVLFLLLSVFSGKAASDVVLGQSARHLPATVTTAEVLAAGTSVVLSISVSAGVFVASVSEDPNEAKDHGVWIGITMLGVENSFISNEILVTSLDDTLLSQDSMGTMGTGIIVVSFASEAPAEVAGENNLISQPSLKKTLLPPQLMEFYHSVPSFVHRSFSFGTSCPLSLIDDQFSFHRLNCLTRRENPGLGLILRRLCFFGTHNFPSDSSRDGEERLPSRNSSPI